MSDCEHKWRLYEDESVRCMICDDILDHPKELAEELMGIFEDLGTMHGLKEQYRSRAEKAEAKVESLKSDFKNLEQTKNSWQDMAKRLEDRVKDLEAELKKRYDLTERMDEFLEFQDLPRGGRRWHHYWNHIKKEKEL